MNCNIISKIKNFFSVGCNLIKTAKEIKDSTDSLHRKLDTSLSGKEEWDKLERKLQEKIEEAKDYALANRITLELFGEEHPDMLWMKKGNGEYMWANKKIRHGLLFSGELKDTIGKNDHYFGAQAVRKFGSENHDFGAYCYGSDEVTIGAGTDMTFIEFGFSGGFPLILDVSKHCIRDKQGNIFATSGSGKDITDRIFKLLKLHCNSECANTITSIEDILSDVVYVKEGEGEAIYNFYMDAIKRGGTDER